jgi:hypothetical protein
MPSKQDLLTRSAITSALQTYTVTDLKNLLSVFKVSQRPLTKADLIKTISEQYGGDSLHLLWSRLDPYQQTAIAEVVHSERDTHNERRYVAKYGHSSQADGSYPSKTARRNGSSYTVFDLFFLGESMLKVIKECLKEFVPEPVKTVLKAEESLPVSIFRNWETFDSTTKAIEITKEILPILSQETERSSQEDVVGILRLIDAGRIAVSEKTHLPTVATFKEVSALLRNGDFYDPQNTKEYADDGIADPGPIKAYAWPLLVQTGRLAEVAGKKLRMTEVGGQAFNKDPADVLRLLWEKWLSNARFDELRRIDMVKGQTGRGKDGLTQPSERREIIVNVLKDCPEGRWVAVAELRRYMMAMGYEFDVTDNPWTLYIEDAGYGAIEGNGNTFFVETCYLNCFLFEYAATLGVIDVGYVPPDKMQDDIDVTLEYTEVEYFSRYDGFLFFRVNALGSYILGKTPSYAHAVLEIHPLLRILPNHEIVLIGERLPMGDQLMLEAYTAKVSDSVWKFDRAKMLLAIENGNGINKLREFLQARTSEPLTPTTLRLLSDIEVRGEQVVDAGLFRLVECKDKVTAALIANDARTKRYCRQVGENYLAVADNQSAAFRRAVRSAGYVMPLIKEH